MIVAGPVLFPSGPLGSLPALLPLPPVAPCQPERRPEPEAQGQQAAPQRAQLLPERAQQLSRKSQGHEQPHGARCLQPPCTLQSGWLYTFPSNLSHGEDGHASFE